MDFDDLLVRTVNLLELFEDVRRPLPRALPLGAGRRVPGHEPRPVPAAAAARRGAREPDRGRRRRPVDLRLPRRRHPQHPRVRATTSPTPTVVKLEQNYRSTQTILDAANAVISHNTGPDAASTCGPTLGEGEPIHVARARGRARRGALRRRRDRAAGRRGHARATRSRSSTGPTPRAGCSRTRWCATSSPTR